MNSYRHKNNDGSIAFGFIILGIGVILLLKKIGFFIPGWILTWPMILIVIGIFSLIKHEFKSFFGAIMLFLGTYFLLRNEFDLDFGLGQYIWPLGLIALGVYLITQKRKENQILEDLRTKWDQKQKSKNPGSGSYGSSVEDAKVVNENAPDGSSESSGQNQGFTRTTGTSFADRLNIDAIFSGVTRKMMSKNFQGGKITAAFGGADLDLTQVDFNGVVTIQVDIIFGGVKMIVPPHWDIRTEVTNIAAGLEDKRFFREGGVDPNKVVVLKGTILFGGLEIKSF
ncbi:MAG: cell wall-active antibiotics response protein [Cyclobacteriaceae bacterium]|nr:cell wall-active antibiotics response protein [Cyclobacteriaceae bacterium]MDX5468185.1 cell wall-active antibiotics response protein [Cyclobacteriaceae bacterium]